MTIDFEDMKVSPMVMMMMVVVILSQLSLTESLGLGRDSQ